LPDQQRPRIRTRRLDAGRERLQDGQRPGARRLGARRAQLRRNHESGAADRGRDDQSGDDEAQYCRTL
jgi:hypothetical protein